MSPARIDRVAYRFILVAPGGATPSRSRRPQRPETGGLDVVPSAHTDEVAPSNATAAGDPLAARQPNDHGAHAEAAQSSPPEAATRWTRTAIARTITSLVDRIDGFGATIAPVAAGAWREFGSLCLLAAGLLQLILAISLARTAIDHAAPTSLYVLLLGSAGAMLISGTLTFFRRRRELIHRLLGSATTASFALALAFLSRSDGDANADALLTFSSLFGALLVVTVVFADQISPETRP